MISVIRMISGGLCAAVAPLWMFYAWYSEDFARYWVYLVAPVIGGLLMMLWYVLIGPGAWRLRLKRFVMMVVVLGLITGLFVGLTRYEGSTGGTSLPKFVWRWAPEIDAEITAAKPVASDLMGDKSGALSFAEGVVDSPQFLGTSRDGVWTDSQLSFDWKKQSPRELWRQPIGAGWSSFAVVGRRAVTQEQRREDELVTCYDLLTGDLLWAHSDRARLESGMGGLGPRATPTIVAERVYVFGGTGILNCLDLSSGKLIWSRDLGPQMKGHFPDWGKSTSPLAVDDLIVVSGAENAAPTLLAFDSLTGKPAWVYEGRGASYSSPRLLEVDGVRQIVSINGKDATGHDPATGKQLWSFDWPGKYPKVAQPLLVGTDQILLTAGYGAGSFLLKVKQQAEAWSVEKIWQSKKMKTKFSSVVIRGDYAYGLDGGIMACIDLKSGKKVWKGGRYGFGQQLLVGDKLLVQTEKGAIAIVKADPAEYEELFQMQVLDHMTWNTPTLAGRYLLVRNDREVVCYDLAQSAGAVKVSER
ncbi:MAG: PQQ-like beta-propeller repeat protein [Verrucomicrobiales bacterium]|nr:PQQ-like beta-propeller repeat protein [Verrucomicrobiales bacterium]